MKHTKAWLRYLALVYAVLSVPDIARAAVAGGGGGGLPYEAGLQTFTTSLQGPVAYAVIMVCVVAGTAAYLLGSQLEGLMSYIAKAIIGVCIIGGAATFLTAIGVAGAII